MAPFIYQRWFDQSRVSLTKCLIRYGSFFIHMFYFIAISIFGFLLLKQLRLKSPTTARPSSIDFLFTSVSAATVSSMSAVEMESFSNSQLIVLILLMVLGGEVFTSMLGLQLPILLSKTQSRIGTDATELNTIESQPDRPVQSRYSTRSKAVRCLGYVVMGYFLVINLAGSLSVLLYVRFVPNARDLLRAKGIKLLTFSVFTAISSFTNCGFIPTNENMLVFKKNSGLLLLIIPQIFLGNTMYPSGLRLSIWALKKVSGRGEFEYLLREKRGTLGYYHWLPLKHCVMLVCTVVGFVVVQVAVICGMEWRSDGFGGMSCYQKTVSVLFLAVNSRHAGESTADLSAMAPAILVLFVLMMYLPPYTMFMPFNDEKCKLTNHTNDKKRMTLVQSLVMSPISYLAIFVILICITERKSLYEDPLNFNALNISFEVTSAYGSVGFSTGYSCARQLKPDDNCTDAWYGFAGKWSNQGKLILIVVMLFGRLKKFNLKSGKAWKLG